MQIKEEAAQIKEEAVQIQEEAVQIKEEAVQIKEEAGSPKRKKRKRVSVAVKALGVKADSWYKLVGPLTALVTHQSC